MTSTRAPRFRTRLFLARRRWQRCGFRRDLAAAWRGACTVAGALGFLAAFYALAFLPALAR